MATNPNVERRIEFDQAERRLFQDSDMLIVIDKLDYKRKNISLIVKILDIL